MPDSGNPAELASSPIAKEKRWWAPTIPSEDRWRVVLNMASHMRQADTGRKEQDERRLRDYGCMLFGGFATHGYKRPVIGSRRKIGYNVIKACSDTFVAKVTKDKPKVSVVTSGGDWELQQR